VCGWCDGYLINLFKLALLYFCSFFACAHGVVSGWIMRCVVGVLYFTRFIYFAECLKFTILEEKKNI